MIAAHREVDKIKKGIEDAGSFFALRFHSIRATKAQLEARANRAIMLGQLICKLKLIPEKDTLLVELAKHLGGLNDDKRCVLLLMMLLSCRGEQLGDVLTHSGLKGRFGFNMMILNSKREICVV